MRLQFYFRADFMNEYNDGQTCITKSSQDYEFQSVDLWFQVSKVNCPSSNVIRKSMSLCICRYQSWLVLFSDSSPPKRPTIVRYDYNSKTPQYFFFTNKVHTNTTQNNKERYRK